MNKTAAGASPVDCQVRPLRRGVDGVCTRSTCACEREGLGDQCIWLRPNDAELESRTGEPHIDGWPLYSGLPPAA
jgi:hypothetical protein